MNDEFLAIYFCASFVVAVKISLLFSMIFFSCLVRITVVMLVFVRVSVCVDCRFFVILEVSFAGVTFYFDLALGNAYHEILCICRNNRYCLDEH